MDINFADSKTCSLRIISLVKVEFVKIHSIARCWVCDWNMTTITRDWACCYETIVVRVLERSVYAACKNIYRIWVSQFRFSCLNIRTLFARVMDTFLFQHYSLNTILAIFYNAIQYSSHRRRRREIIFQYPLLS